MDMFCWFLHGIKQIWALIYHISSVIKLFFFLPKQSQKTLGLFRKGKTCIIAKFHRTNIVVYSHSRKGKTPPYSGINTVTEKRTKCNTIVLLFKSHLALNSFLPCDTPNAA